MSVNLNVLKKLKKYSNKIGYSDHTIGSLTSCLAVSLGATIIEKHFTLNKKMVGPDHKASANPSDLINLVRDIRRTETILGSENKQIQPEEKDMLKISKKGLYFSRNLKFGTKIKLQDILNLRPANSLTSFDFKQIVGKKVNRNVSKFMSISKKLLNE